MYEIEMMGDIVNEAWWNGDVSPKSIKDELKIADGDDVYVHMNSGGGSTVAGSAIINMMRAYKGTITVHNIGISASMASVILAEADVAQMADNALLMIHNPWSMAVGDADDMKHQADLLDKIKASLMTAYIRKTGLSEDKISEMMDAETWLTAQEAFDMGFVDEITTAQEAVAHSSLELFGGKKLPEQAKAYFKQKQTEDNMSEENKEKGKLWDSLVAHVAKVLPAKEPVVEPKDDVVVDVTFNKAQLDEAVSKAKSDIEVEMKSQLDAKDAELAKLKVDHEADMSAKDVELADSKIKAEMIVEAFAEEKLTCAEVASLLVSEKDVDKIKSELEAKDPHNLTQTIDKKDTEISATMWDKWASMEDSVEQQKFYKENREQILKDKKEL